MRKRKSEGDCVSGFLGVFVEAEKVSETLSELGQIWL